MSEEDMKALVEMCQMLKAENTKLKQEKKEQKEKLDNIKYLCETTGLDNYYLVPIIKTEIILQILNEGEL